MSTRNKGLILTGIILLAVSAAVFIIGFWLQGFNFAAFFKSQTFIISIALIVIYVIAVLALIIYDKIKKL